MQKPTYAVESVDNALQLLLMLHHLDSLGVTEAAEELGVAPSTVHRLLAMLKFRGFATQGPDHRYRLSALSRQLAHRSAPSLPAVAAPHLEWLSHKTRETVHLMARSGASVRFIECVEGESALRIASRVGKMLPAHLTSGGRVLLAALPPQYVAGLYPEFGRDEGDFARLLRRLSVVRQCGYATNIGETERGVNAIGVPIRDDTSCVVAALAISTPSVRYQRRNILTLLPAARAAAERISCDLAA